MSPNLKVWHDLTLKIWNSMLEQIKFCQDQIISLNLKMNKPNNSNKLIEIIHNPC